jgi:hypothetical protein
MVLMGGTSNEETMYAIANESNFAALKVFMQHGVELGT